MYTTLAVTNNTKPNSTVNRVFQSFFGQTLTISLLMIVQSVLRCWAAVGISDSAFWAASLGCGVEVGEGEVAVEKDEP